MISFSSSSTFCNQVCCTNCRLWFGLMQSSMASAMPMFIAPHHHHHASCVAFYVSMLPSCNMQHCNQTSMRLFIMSVCTRYYCNICSHHDQAPLKSSLLILNCRLQIFCYEARLECTVSYG